MQNFPKTSCDLEEGDLFRRGIGGSMSEIAQVLELGTDRMGIPHVRFNMWMSRGNYASENSEQRTLAVETFCARYRERVQIKRQNSEANN